MATIVKVAARGDGGAEVTYAAEAGKTIKPKEVEDALKADQKLLNEFGSKVSIVASEAKGDGPQSARLEGKFGKVVGALSSKETAALQTNLCLKGSQVDGQWGMRTQAALIKDRERKKAAGEQGVAQGLLTASEAKALMSRSQDEVAKACGQ